MGRSQLSAIRLETEHPVLDSLMRFFGHLQSTCHSFLGSLQQDFRKAFALKMQRGQGGLWLSARAAATILLLGGPTTLIFGCKLATT